MMIPKTARSDAELMTRFHELDKPHPKAKNPVKISSMSMEWKFRVLLLMDRVPFSHRFSPVFAYSMVFIMFVFGWGVGLLGALQYLANPNLFVTSVMTNGEARSSFIVSAVASILPLAVALAVMRFKRITFRDLNPGKPGFSGRYERLAQFSTGFIAVLVFVLALSIGSKFFGGGNYPNPSHQNSWEIATTFMTSFFAGFAEELCLVALPVYLLRNAGQRWAVIFPILVALRMSFHIYYGWALLPVVIWPIFVLLLYRSNMRLYGLMFVHSGWDLSVTLWTHIGNSALGSILLDVEIIVALAVLYYWTRQARRRLVLSREGVSA